MAIKRINVNETIRDLEALGSVIIPKVGRPAVEMGAKAAVIIAKATAPRRSGEYAESIHMIGPDGRPDAGATANGEALAGPEAATDSRVQAVVGSALWRAHYIEFGTGPSKKPRGNPRGTPARNTVGNAVRQAGQAVEDGIDRYMDELLRELGFR